MKYLIKKCQCNVDKENNAGITALHSASLKGLFDIVKFLVEECNATITDEIIGAAKENPYIYLREQQKKQKRNQNQ